MGSCWPCESVTPYLVALWVGATYDTLPWHTMGWTHAIRPSPVAHWLDSPHDALSCHTVLDPPVMLYLSHGGLDSPCDAFTCHTVGWTHPVTSSLVTPWVGPTPWRFYLSHRGYWTHTVGIGPTPWRFYLSHRGYWTHPVTLSLVTPWVLDPPRDAFTCHTVGIGPTPWRFTCHTVGIGPTPWRPHLSHRGYWTHPVTLLLVTHRGLDPPRDALTCHTMGWTHPMTLLLVTPWVGPTLQRLHLSHRGLDPPRDACMGWTRPVLHYISFELCSLLHVTLQSSVSSQRGADVDPSIGTVLIGHHSLCCTSVGRGHCQHAVCAGMSACVCLCVCAWYQAV